MRKTLFLLLFITSFFSIAQGKNTIEWLSKNSIQIEDASPDSQLKIFHEQMPEKFKNAKVFGFGEASHNTKEFFDIKAKFFKYLVEYHGVKAFIMEESYQAEKPINEWISGGKGDAKTIGKNFRLPFWSKKEVIDLLQWMRNYNQGKSSEDQIRFYGMDVKHSDRIHTDVRAFINQYELKISTELLDHLDSIANRKLWSPISMDEAKKKIVKLQKLQQELMKVSKQEKITEQEINTPLRSINYLIRHLEYVKHFGDYKNANESRDRMMFENAKWVIEKETKNRKAFIWGHNEHINKREMYFSGSGIINLGNHLKNYFKDDYYAVGFDFGTGKINGFVASKKKGNYWKSYTIEKPYKKTYAKTLMSIDKDIFFIDIENAVMNEPSGFFDKTMKQLLIAAGGFQPKPLHRIMMNKVYSKSYDGLIFVKQISKPTPIFGKQ